MTITFREIEFGSPTFHLARELRHNVLRAPIGRSFDDEDLTEESTQIHFGLFVRDVLVGCVIAVPISPKEAKVRQMAVSFESQGRGYGRQILEHLESELAQRGFAHLWMHARTTAIGFYEKLAYTRMGPEFVEIGIPHVKMVKCLTRH
ncbi:MAG TPA: GNAT family N-acetyltransferase [Opitutaceae bacterium]|nr:GNAT family N-acetyltransferase [Opitutaceae bacterium]